MRPPPAFEKIKLRAEEVGPGDWFLPVDREGRDQHSAIPAAIARGAAGFFFEPENLDPPRFPAVTSVPVPSLRELLYGLAREKRGLCGGRFAVVTGSAGKSTVKEMLASIALAAGESFHKSPGNQNTKLALCAQILALPAETAYAFLEVGARREGDLAPPLAFLRPETVALLNIGRAHLGEFGSPEILRRTKLSALAAESARTLVVPGSDPAIVAFARAQGKRVLTFGTGPGAGHDYAAAPGPAGGFTLHGEGGRFPVPAPAAAPGFLANAAAAAAVARSLGFSWPAVQSGLARAPGMPGRFETRRWGGRLIIDDAFNSSPESLLAGLHAFFAAHGGRPAALALGSVLELGESSRRIHEELGEALGRLSRAAAHPVLLVTVGEEAESLGARGRETGGDRVLLRHFATAAEAASFLRESDAAWEALYLKGSKATGLHGLLAD